MATVNTVHFNKKGFTHSPYTKSTITNGLTLYDNSGSPKSDSFTISISEPLQAWSVDEISTLLTVDQTGTFEAPNILFTLSNGDSREVSIQEFFQQLEKKSGTNAEYNLNNPDFVDLHEQDYITFFQSKLDGFIEGNDTFFKSLTDWIGNAMGIEQQFATMFSSLGIDSLDLS